MLGAGRRGDRDVEDSGEGSNSRESRFKLQYQANLKGVDQS